MTIMRDLHESVEDLTLLRAFVCIVECGSISAGTRSLRVFAKDVRPTLREADVLA
jgi:DNA-binding transcriptional LysR family regulator